MMLNKKNVLYFISLSACMFLLSKRSSGMFDYLYAGVEFHDTMMVYGLHFWNIAILGMYIGMDFYHYMKTYSSYLMIRNHNRKRIYCNFQIMVLKKVLCYEVYKIFLFTIFIWLNYRDIHISNINDCLWMMMLYILLEIVLMNMLLFVEICIHPKVAIIFVFSYFILSLGLGDMFIGMKVSKIIYLFLLPNVGMQLRLFFLDVTPQYIVLILISVIVTLYVIGMKRIVKKDII